MQEEPEQARAEEIGEGEADDALEVCGEAEALVDSEEA